MRAGRQPPGRPETSPRPGASDVRVARPATSTWSGARRADRSARAGTDRPSLSADPRRPLGERRGGRTIPSDGKGPVADGVRLLAGAGDRPGRTPLEPAQTGLRVVRRRPGGSERSTDPVPRRLPGGAAARPGIGFPRRQDHPTGRRRRRRPDRRLVTKPFHPVGPHYRRSPGPSSGTVRRRPAPRTVRLYESRYVNSSWDRPTDAVGRHRSPTGADRCPATCSSSSSDTWSQISQSRYEWIVLDATDDRDIQTVFVRSSLIIVTVTSEL